MQALLPAWLHTESVRVTGRRHALLTQPLTRSADSATDSAADSADVTQQDAVIAEDESGAGVGEFDLVQVPRDAVGRAVALPGLAVVLAL